MGKYTVFCRKSGATWGIFVANQGQVGEFLLQIRGKFGKFCRKSGASWEIFVANQGQVDFFCEGYSSLCTGFSQREKRLPLLIFDFTVRRPRRRSAITLHIESPSPVPCTNSFFL